MPSTGFALVTIYFVYLSLGSSTTGPHFPGVVASPSGHIELENTLHNRWGYDSAFALGVGKQTKF